VFWALLLVVVALAFTRHENAAEGILAGLVIGGFTGGIGGYRRGRANATPVPSRKPATARGVAPRNPNRVTYGKTPKTAPAIRRTGTEVRSDNALLAEMEHWSEECLELDCGACSGWNVSEKCTHCNHPAGRSKTPPAPNDDIPPY
jgi:hypothetical protein